MSEETLDQVENTDSVEYTNDQGTFTTEDAQFDDYDPSLEDMDDGEFLAALESKGLSLEENFDEGDMYTPPEEEEGGFEEDTPEEDSEEEEEQEYEEEYEEEFEEELEDDSETDVEPLEEEEEVLEDNSTPETKDDDIQAIQAAYEKIFAPFKANGIEYKFDTPEQVIASMQKGLNYESKMNRIKPHLRLTNALQKNGIDDNTLNTLIAVKNGDKAAISEILRNNNISAYDLEDIDEGEVSERNYVQTPESFERQYNLDEAINQLKDNGTYNTIGNVVMNVWDEQSQGIISQDPSILIKLSSLVEEGVFSSLFNTAQNLKLTDPSLANVSDVDVFGTVYHNYVQSQQQQQQKRGNSPQDTRNPGQEQSQKPTPSKKIINRREVSRRRKGVAPTPRKGNPAPSNEKIPEVNFMTMTDAEFEEFDKKYGDSIMEMLNN